MAQQSLRHLADRLKIRRLPTKNRLILPKINRYLVVSLLMFVPLAQARASIVSFVNSLAQASASPVSAQETIHVFPHEVSSMLVAAINSDPNPIKLTIDISIDDDALMPSVTPEGVVFVEGISSVTDSGPTQISRYVVHKGDTLGAIAKMYGVSVNTVRWANDLKTGQVLKVGQELLILPVTGVQYVVKKGDTLASIAKKFKGDQKEIILYNALASASDLNVGDELIIPDGVEAAAVVRSPAGTSRYIPGNNGPEIAGYFARPLPASCPRTQGLHGHNGIDIGCPAGTSISAAAPGEVTIARADGYNGGYGKFAVVTHQNGTQTLYAHMSQVNVAAGQYVVQGQKIGEVGHTGKSTGNHLHFEVRGAKNPF